MKGIIREQSEILRTEIRKERADREKNRKDFSHA